MSSPALPNMTEILRQQPPFLPMSSTKKKEPPKSQRFLSLKEGKLKLVMMLVAVILNGKIDEMPSKIASKYLQ